ncbi:bifunctional diaminohydroxyphosphoribosylaminopyrimidine deaminase/5-amino-6-(5-phosphoribosylamino)uracil reductase RibD [Planctomycetaceae bacterium SH139]
MQTQSAVDPQIDAQWMRRALELAKHGEGLVEPNPMVGCVIVRDGQVLAEGWHRHFGGLHAERDALAKVGEQADLSGATWYVTLEPCCHAGKTPPCSGAVIASRPRRVVVAMRDPFPLVNGGGFREIQAAGIEVTVGVEALAAQDLCAPFLKRLQTGRPWVIAKWAMTLDGKIATACGDSRWISSPESRRYVHALRGRVDAVIVGAGTAAADDPRLTTRPPGPRTATRIVIDRHASLALDCQLVRTAREVPVRVFTSSQAPAAYVEAMQGAGVDVVSCDTAERGEMLGEVLDHCGRDQMTNVLVEGGGTLLGAMHDAQLIDEVHAFIAPKIVGGQAAMTPVEGRGLTAMRDAIQWQVRDVKRIEDDVLMIARRPLASSVGV